MNHNNKSIVCNIERLQRINTNLIESLRENNIYIRELIIKQYYKHDELHCMSDNQMIDFYELLVSDFRYLKEVFDKEVFFRSLIQ